jgi:FixJ family two-component response regulator
MQSDVGAAGAAIAFLERDASARRSRSEWLREAHFEVLELESAAAFLSLEREHPPLGVLAGAEGLDVPPLELLGALAERQSPHAVAFLGAAPPEQALAALRAGAVDWREVQTPAELVEIGLLANQQAALRGYWLTAGEGEAALTRLTPREHETLRLVLEGHSSKIIAQQMGVTTKTVEQHRSNVMHKLEVASVAQLVLRSLRTRTYGIPYLARPRRH